MEKKKLLRENPVPLLDFKRKYNGTAKYIIKAVIGTGDVLIIYMYSLRAEPLYSILIDRQQAEFCTYDHTGKSFRAATIVNLIEYNSWRIKDGWFMYADDESAHLGGIYFGQPLRETLDAVSDWQLNLRSYQLRLSTEKMRSNIDAVMSTVEPLPENIDKWIDRIPMKYSRYIYYHKDNSRLIGFCTHCRHDVGISHPPKGLLADKEGICPNCRSKIKYKHDSRSASFRDHGTFQYICSVPDGIMITKYQVDRWYDRGAYKKSINQKIYASERQFISYSEKHTNYVYESRNKTYEIGCKWYVSEQKKNRYYYSYDNYFSICYSICYPVYPYNTAKVLKGTPWKWSGFPEFVKGGHSISILYYLQDVGHHPIIEKMAKVGLYRLVKYAVLNSYSAVVQGNEDSLCSALGINRADLKLCAKYDLNHEEFCLLRLMRDIKRPFADSEIKDIRSLFDDDCVLDNNCLSILNRLSIKKIIKYIKCQKVLDDSFVKNERHYTSFRYIVRDWTDYIKDCGELGYDMKNERILCPRNLSEAHTALSAELTAFENQDKDIIFAEIVPTLSYRYEYTDGQYLIRPAHSVTELIEEGKALSHCVGQYADKMLNGLCVILLLRSAAHPEQPFVTVEVQESTDVSVIQIRAKRNAVPPDDVMSWFEKYKKNVLSNIKFDDTVEDEHLKTQKAG